MQLNQDHAGSLLYETVTTKIIFGRFLMFFFLFSFFICSYGLCVCQSILSVAIIC